MDEMQQVEQNRKNQISGKSLGIGLAIGALLSAVFILGGILLYMIVSNMVNRPQSSNIGMEALLNDQAVDKIEMITNTIDHYYMGDVDNQMLQDGIYSGLLDSLGDPYSVYYTEEEVEELLQSTEGTFYGIGAYIGMGADTNMPTISRTMDDSPAKESGLLAGDVIMKVDGEDIAGYSLEEVISRVKGEEGTTVVLTVYRETESDYLDLSIVRRKVETDTIAYEMLADQIAHISIFEFDKVTVDQFAKAMELARMEGMKGLIFDLRGNPGGNVDTVVEILRMILPEGIIVYTEDKYGERVEYTGKGETPLAIPLVVLVDSASASASEIMAGAIRDYHMGTLMGTTTFGKGIVQSIIMLNDGTAVKITVSNYFTPSGLNIHGIGIEPDIEVPFDGSLYLEEGIDNQLEAAVEELQQQLQ